MKQTSKSIRTNKRKAKLKAKRRRQPAPGDEQFRSLLIEVPRGEHSEKPAAFEWPNTAKLEMFARTARPGWDVWSNEVEAAPSPTALPTSPPPNRANNCR